MTSHLYSVTENEVQKEQNKHTLQMKNRINEL